MNCHEFERTIIDRGCDHLVDPSTKARALAHAESCAQCAARLNREQRMTAALQAFAAEDGAINAPERLKLALRRAFFEQQAAAASPRVLLGSAHRKLIWGMAAGVMLLLSLISTAIWLRVADEKVHNAPPVLPDQRKPQAPPGKTPVALAEAQRSRKIHSAIVAGPSGRIRGRRSFPVNTKETAGFLPLTFVARPGPTEFVQTVRVVVSRSTLLTMGLPVNVDRGDKLIKADIIIGEDGVARAVRILN
ncbi:MAG: hypothetical protein L0220_26750 [Acidobacteria bacterium]|nr:hypothetical protein [Acidobacteriota bacterium]